MAACGRLPAVAVGIEVRRARVRRVRWRIHRFPDGPQSGSRYSLRFRKPPCDSGRRDFPVPVLRVDEVVAHLVPHRPHRADFPQWVPQV